MKKLLLATIIMVASLSVSAAEMKIESGQVSKLEICQIDGEEERFYVILEDGRRFQITEKSYYAITSVWCETVPTTLTIETIE